MYTNLFLFDYPGNEVFHSIVKSKKKSVSHKVLLGDSVGNQLFSNKTNHEPINSLACNQAVGLIGQYFLLNNYLNAGNKIEEAFMLFNPFTFRNNLNQRFTYHYFLKPFYNSEYDSLFTVTVENQIEKIPYHSFAQLPPIYITSWAPDYKSQDGIDYTFLSPISIEYLAKIKALSIKHNFKLTFIPAPTNIEKKDLIDKINVEEFAKANLTEEFEAYFNKLIYLDPSKFSDGVHLVQPEIYTKKLKASFIN